MLRMYILPAIFYVGNALKIQHESPFAPDMSQAQDCLRLTTPSLKLQYPVDAEDHFQELHEALKPYLRNHHMHCYASYCGPWIENLWISHFNSTWSKQGPGARLHSLFGPYIPIFFPWVDTLVNNNFTYPKGFGESLLKILRPNVAYVTVSQNDEGIPGGEALGFGMDKIPNVLVLSSGGYGHIPLPLFKEKQQEKVVPLSSRSLFMSFMGSLDTWWLTEKSDSHTSPKGLRITMANVVSKHHSDEHHVFVGQGSNWTDVMADSRFTLCPRGFGRNSFRLTEAIQMHRTPIYIYSDIPWIPYAEKFKDIGYVSKVTELDQLVKQLLAKSDDEISKNEDRLREFSAKYFSVEGVMRQIGSFMNHALFPDKSDLICQPLPRTVRG